MSAAVRCQRRHDVRPGGGSILTLRRALLRAEHMSLVTVIGRVALKQSIIVSLVGLLPRPSRSTYGLIPAPGGRRLPYPDYADGVASGHRADISYSKGKRRLHSRPPGRGMT
jgi:hypothetical protein